MSIFLYGPSGSGKSTVGKYLAQTLNLPFLDLDSEIEIKLGTTIIEIMANQGENVFRDAEANVLQNTVNGVEKVVALGGGTLLRDENRELVEKSGKVIFLKLDLRTLETRLSHDRHERPLLAGDLSTKLATMLENRQAHYESFDLCSNAFQPPHLVVSNIQRLLGRYHLRGMGRGYDVVVKDGGLHQFGEMLRSRRLDGPVLVVSDTNVAPLYGERVIDSLKSAGYTANKLVIKAGEKYKTLETVSMIWHNCLEGGLDRSSTIIALGGGVVGDLTGFAASTFMRGCQWVALPTTLLAMVDASLGGKTGFDLPEGKNLIGAFHPPRLVLADTETLITLPERELRAGLAEVVKHGVIADRDLFDLCAQGWDELNSHLPEVVRRGMAVKVRVIEEDPYEQGKRAALNFGHTIGHAVELVSGFTLLHGEAVSIGMAAEAKLAERLKVAKSGLSEALIKTLKGLGLPVDISDEFSRDELIQAMKMDKKKADGVVRFTLPVKIGEVEVGVEVKDLKTVFEELK